VPSHCFFDEIFRKRHPEVCCPSAGDPDQDKEIGDSSSLRPVLSNIFSAHPDFSYGTFIGDAAFDSYEDYSMLKNLFGFRGACIPMNPSGYSARD